MEPNRPRPLPSHPYNYSGHAGPSSSNVTAQALTAALSNPYRQTQFGAYGQASHYAQAYAQYYNQTGPSVTAEGYTISSTYVPGTPYNQYRASQHTLPAPGQRTQTPSHGHGPGGWYQAGNSRCSKQGCSFTGSKKSVELHMMDRHLIYPASWEHRKKRDDWDADPSLKGKPIPIQGTSIRLDTPEAITAWIAERKKRFPTAQNAAEKEQKKREAIERGQLPFDDGYRKKRRRTDDGPGGQAGNFRERGGHRGRGRGRGRRRGGGDNGWDGRQPDGTRTPAAATEHSSRPTVPAKRTQDEKSSSSSGSDSDSDSDSDGAPEVVSSKPPPDVQLHDAASMEEDSDEEATTSAVAPGTSQEPPQPVKKPRPKQPRKPLYNPFTQRPSLLQNLLLPEIRMTVSNLSQAIRFLVDNDFLHNVELKPGQANERMIEVIGEQPTPADDTNTAADEPSSSDI